MGPKIFYSDADKKKALARPNSNKNVKVIKAAASTKPISKIKLTKPPTKLQNNKNNQRIQQPKTVILKPNAKQSIKKPNVAPTPVIITRNYQPIQQQQNITQFRSNKNSVSSLTVAIESANAIASNRSHPNQAEVEQLLKTLEKGWIDEKKFLEVLPSLLF